jgi:hypothetical protein
MFSKDEMSWDEHDGIRPTLHLAWTLFTCFLGELARLAGRAVGRYDTHVVHA